MDVVDVLPRDAIPSIDDPAFGSDYFGDPDDEVVVVDGDPPRAYPVRILSYHEIVNDILEPGSRDPRTASDDVVDGRPVAVTWCPICWSAAVYDRTVGGRTLTFGVSGTLADDALVMYDRETGSEWKQTRGECFAGEFEGETLTVLPAPIVAWERFRDDNPDGVVLQPVRGGDGSGDPAPEEAYDMAPYERYADGGPFGLYGMRGEGAPRSWDRDDIDPKTVVLGVVHGDDAVGYPVPRVAAAGGVVTDTVGGLDVVVTVEDGIHAFEDPGFAFEMRDGTLHADGTTWDPTTGEGADGRRLERVPARRLFAFAWQDDHGPDSLYSPA